MDGEVVSLFRCKQMIISLILSHQANKLFPWIGHGQEGILGVRQFYQFPRHGKDDVLLPMEEYCIPQRKPVFSRLTRPLPAGRLHALLRCLLFCPFSLFRLVAR